MQLLAEWNKAHSYWQNGTKHVAEPFPGLDPGPSARSHGGLYYGSNDKRGGTSWFKHSAEDPGSRPGCALR
ncbi:MAG: hypothetical protein COA52_15370 [Hyphomicrobiales bacterium]|nr:MAG: hypothetical protein COA52_15370 [Hyphomicrobiales bacterium]